MSKSVLDGSTLTGIRVVDVGDRLATAWCSRLLADYGADVVLVESHRNPLENEKKIVQEKTEPANLLVTQNLPFLSVLKRQHRKELGIMKDK